MSVWEAPPDGLQDVDYDDLTGGFPIYSFAKTSDGEVEKLLDRRARTSGDSIFRPRAADRRTMRADPYYPDPAASYIVIALRDLAGRVLPGVPLVVPVQGEKLAYPNVRPVAIEVVAHPVRSGQPPGHERMLSLMAAGGKVLHGSEVFAGKTEPATVRLDGGPFVKGGAGGVEATHVVVRLEPGESVEIDVWCLPTEDQLAGWFDVIESSALIAAYDAKTGKTCPDCSTFVTQLKGLKIEGIDTFLRQIALSRAGADLPICAGGQLSIPRGALRCMAKLAHDSLLARPTPEIAARETIRATHAIAKPHAAPSIGTRERPTIGVRRVDKPPPLAAAPAPAPVVAAPAPAPVAPAPVAPAPGGPAPAPAPAAPAAVGPAAPVAAPAAPVGKAPASVAVPSSEIVLDGSVTVHRPTTAFFEIRAQGPSLVSNAFDDHENRHRTPDEVARGLWPRSPVTGRRLSVQDIYGFDVNAKGVVTLRSERATLLRVDLDIPESGDKHAGNEPLELDELRKEAEKAVTDREAAEKAAAKAGVAPPRPTGRGNVVRMSRPFTITDTRARFLSMRAVAGSRTAWCFRDGKGDVFADDDATRHSDENKPLDHLVEVVCEAGKAPAKVAPLTILPAFSLRQTGDAASGFTVERRVKLRIRMRRPWFTSGEGERLGIVLWPPDILKGERITASGGGVTRDYDGPPEEAVIAMQAFEDEDLGPGGAFVTRWGLDPIKGGPGHLGWVMPPEAFGDLEGAAERPPKGVRWPLEEAVYVPRATIPLPVDEDGKARASLEAALLTFAPRFDIDHETWYCDVEVCPGIAPEPFIRLGLVRYQPHAPPELQVSEPVVEWAQAPPYRKVVVTLDKDDSRRVKVEASGPGRTHGSASPPGPETRIESWAQRPIMKVSVHRRRSNGVEEVAELAEAPGGASEKFGRRAERVWAPRTQKEWTEALTLHRAQPGPEEPHPPFAVRPKALGYTGVALTWKTDFLLAEAPLAPRVPETTYAVVVEEVEPMLPSTFVDEPIEPDVPAHETREEMTYSGPRFAAKVEIR